MMDMFKAMLDGLCFGVLAHVKAPLLEDSNGVQVDRVCEHMKSDRFIKVF